MTWRVAIIGAGIGREHLAGYAALPERFRSGLANWDLTRLEPYQPEYLAGFRAEAYTIELEPAFQEARVLTCPPQA